MEDNKHSEKKFTQDRTDPAENQTTGLNLGWNPQSVCRIVGVSFGLLCLCQVILNIVLRIHYMKQSRKAYEDHEGLLIDYTNLLEETDELQMNYTELIEERDLLLANYTDLAEEKDLLSMNTTDLVEARDLCLTRYRNLVSDKKQLLAHTSNLTIKYNSLVKEKNQLLTRYNSLTAENKQLLTSYNTVVDKRERYHKKLQQAGWLLFQSSLYFFSTDKKTWNDSRCDCQQRGADLVIITSQEEQDFVRNNQDEGWIGLHDISTEGVWVWVDSTQLIKGFWNSGEPNNFNDEDCAHFFKDDWNDLSCLEKKAWTCEIGV